MVKLPGETHARRRSHQEWALHFLGAHHQHRGSLVNARIREFILPCDKKFYQSLLGETMTGITDVKKVNLLPKC